MLTQGAEVERRAAGPRRIEAISRRALADVRQAIRRYRADLIGTVPELLPSRRRRGGGRAAIRSASAPRDHWWPMIFTIYIVYLPVGFYRAGGGTSSTGCS